MNDHIAFSLYRILKRFPNNESARLFMEQQRWCGMPICAKCGHGHSVALHGNRRCFYRCTNCRTGYSVRSNSIFANSKVGLDKWLMAMYMMVTARKGISCMQLSKELDITQKTGWFLCHRIRKAMSSGKHNGLLEGIIEVDETCVVGKASN